MKYRIVGSGTDSVGHRLLILQNQKSLDIIQAFDTEIEVRPCHYQVQYVLKAITLDDRRVWLQTTSNLPDAVAEIGRASCRERV